MAGPHPSTPEPWPSRAQKLPEICSTSARSRSNPAEGGRRRDKYLISPKDSPNPTKPGTNVRGTFGRCGPSFGEPGANSTASNQVRPNACATSSLAKHRIDKRSSQAWPSQAHPCSTRAPRLSNRAKVGRVEPKLGRNSPTVIGTGPKLVESTKIWPNPTSCALCPLQESLIEFMQQPTSQRCWARRKLDSAA